MEIVECEYRNYQPFYPGAHLWTKGDTGIPHGEQLQVTVDMAARLSRREIWQVERTRSSTFDTSIERSRSPAQSPGPKQDPGDVLEVDLFLANAYDRTPILGAQAAGDQCPFYALIQLLTQAAYAVTPHSARGWSYWLAARVRPPGGDTSRTRRARPVRAADRASPRHRYDELRDAAIALSQS